MKKLLSLSLISAVLCTALITLSACGQEEAPPKEEENPPREEKAPPKEKEEEAPPEEEEDSPPEEETQPEEEETPPKEEGTASQEPSCQEQLIGTWQLVEVYMGLGPSGPSPQIENGYTYTFMADGNFIFKMNGYDYDPNNEGFYRLGECYIQNTIYVVADESKGRFKFLDDCTINLELVCGGGKRIVEYGYGFDDSGSLIMEEVVDPDQYCDEGCYDIFKKVN